MNAIFFLISGPVGEQYRIYPNYSDTWSCKVFFLNFEQIHVGLTNVYSIVNNNPVSILYKSTAGRYRPVRVADGPITARCIFIKNASWECASEN